MHETIVAQSLLEAIEAEAAKQNGKVVRVKISCGQISAINDEAMHSAFEIAAKGGSCDGAELVIEHIPLKGNCRSCGRDFVLDLYSPKCTNCGSDDFALNEDAPLLLEEIEISNDK